MESLPAPFETNCAAERRLRIMDYFGVKYSKPACIRECLLLGIVRICKCQPLQRIIGRWFSLYSAWAGILARSFDFSFMCFYVRNTVFDSAISLAGLCVLFSVIGA